MKYLVLNKVVESKIEADEELREVPINSEPSIISQYFMNSKKTRRFRSAFTTEQIEYLETEYQKFPYIGSGKRKEVSTVLNIPERAIKIWFQNRRMKEKKETADEEQKTNIHQEQSSIQTFNQLPSTPPYSLRQPQFKKIYPDPSITKASIKNFAGNRNLCASSSTPQDKPRITVKDFNSSNFTNTKRTVDEPTATASRPLNHKYTPMTSQTNLRAANIPTEQNVYQRMELGEVKNYQRDLPTETRSPRVQPNYYPIHPNQDQRYMPLHVQTLPQPLPGNILWKPVNIMPVLPGVGPQAVVSHNSFTVMNPNIPKEGRKCNCTYNSQEVPNLLQVPPQYILAVPFNYDRI